MVFGDNVRARKAARALPRTPTTKEERRAEERRRQNRTKQNKEDEQRDRTPSTAIPQ